MGLSYQVLAAVLLSFCLNSAFSQYTDLFEDDFELGIGDWFADNGLWEVGVPTAGPDAAFSGENVAGAVLGGNYPTDANTRLISPAVELSTVSAGEQIRLRFRHWFSFSFGDNGVLQVSVDGSEWQAISTVPFDGSSSAWTQFVADLTAFAGSTVRVGFLLHSDSNPNTVSTGWYVDDVRLESGLRTFRNPDDFELGIGDWFADNGLWEVGFPTAGPDAAFSGENVAGTVLGGNYPMDANTRLISPAVELPTVSAGEEIRLRFWHWFSFSFGDNGVLQVSVDGSEWQTISAVPFDGSSNAWTQFVADLTAFAGSTVRVGFLLHSDSNPNTVSTGWYVDDVTFEGVPTTVSVEDGPPASEFKLLRAFPNPFSTTTTISYELPRAAGVKLTVFDLLGRKVRILAAGLQQAGTHRIPFVVTEPMSSSVYLYRLEAEDFTETKSMVILR